MSCCERCQNLEERIRKLDREKARATACATEAEKQLTAVRAALAHSEGRLLTLQRQTAQQRFMV